MHKSKYRCKELDFSRQVVFQNYLEYVSIVHLIGLEVTKTCR